MGSEMCRRDRRYKDELTAAQAARKLGVTSSTIRSHKKNALDTFVDQFLTKDGETVEEARKRLG